MIICVDVYLYDTVQCPRLVLSFCGVIYAHLHDLERSQHYCCWFKSSEMWRSIEWWIIADVSGDYSAFICKVTQSNLNYGWTSWSWNQCDTILTKICNFLRVEISWNPSGHESSCMWICIIVLHIHVLSLHTICSGVFSQFAIYFVVILVLGLDSVPSQNTEKWTNVPLQGLTLTTPPSPHRALCDSFPQSWNDQPKPLNKIGRISEPSHERGM